MSMRLFGLGKQALAAGSIVWGTDTIKAMLVGFTADTHIKAITGATNATPIVATATAHGWADGDVVVTAGIGGNTAANGTFKLAGSTANTFNLQTFDGASVVGNGAYTSGGYAINLSKAQFLADIDAGRVGTDVTLTTKTSALGVLDCDDIPYPLLTGAQVWGLAIYKDTGVAATSPLLYWCDGKTLVTVAAAASISATSIAVEKLEAAIASGATIPLSNGVTATLSAQANAGDRVLTVSALSAAVAAGHHGDAATLGTGLPLTPSGTNVTFQIDNGIYRLVEI